MSKLSLNLKLTTILLFFLASAVINSLMIVFVVNGQIENARSINLAGRQRMLSQKISKEVFMLMIKADNDEELSTHKQKLMDTVKTFDSTLNGLLYGDEELGLSASEDQEIKTALNSVYSTWKDFKKNVEDLVVLENPASPEGYDYMNAISLTNIPLLKAMNDAVTLFEKKNNSHKIILLQVILLVFTSSIVLISWFFTRRDIILPLKEINAILLSSSGMISQAASTVAEAADNIADRASSQAAALEESSASLEEITATSRQNAENTAEADNLMQETTVVVDQANELMKNVKNSMGEISASGEEIGKIIKTIDEIAFQTNLLALNAAVEAARAGEAGAGFAVVADEVRNLAMRAADAAKNTSGMIEEVIEKIAAGSKLVDESNKSFNDVTNRSKKVAILTADIMKSIQEQSSGVSQISTGINDMDRVTQENAATSEESASVSRDMKSESEKLLMVVSKLGRLIEGEEKKEQEFSQNQELALPLE